MPLTLVAYNIDKTKVMIFFRHHLHYKKYTILGWILTHIFCHLKIYMKTCMRLQEKFRKRDWKFFIFGTVFIALNQFKDFDYFKSHPKPNIFYLPNPFCLAFAKVATIIHSSKNNNHSLQPAFHAVGHLLLSLLTTSTNHQLALII